MTRQSQLLALPLILTLAACGGGGTAMVASAPPPLAMAAAPTPAPTPGPTPTPTPAPTPAPSPAPDPGPAPTLTSSETSLTPLSGYSGQVAGTTSAIAIKQEVKAGIPLFGLNGPESAQIVPAGSVSLTAAPATRSYTLEVAVSPFPMRAAYDLSHADDLGNVLSGPGQFGNHVTIVDHFSDGSSSTRQFDAVGASVRGPVTDTSATTAESLVFRYNLGLHYVSFGAWERSEYVKDSACNCYRGGQGFPVQTLLFVTGRRTEAAELPRSGTAIYSASLVDNAGNSANTIRLIDTFTLSADFGRQTIAARLFTQAGLRCCGIEEGRFTVTGLDVNGAGPIRTDGGFTLALAGTSLTPGGGPGGTDLSGRISGGLEGAFFGPSAEEAGGVLQLLRDGALAVAGTFVGTRN